MKKTLVWCAAGLSALLLGGCFAGASSSQTSAAERKRSYLPALGAAPELAKKPLFAAAKVRAVSAAAPFDSAQWVVRRANGETVFDFYTSWIVPPQEALGAQLVRFFGQTGLFGAVYAADAGTAARLGLDCQVTECLLDCTGAVPMATVGVRVLVLDERAADFTALALAECREQAKVAGDGEDAAAKAFGEAFTKAFGGAARELAKVSLPK